MVITLPDFDPVEFLVHRKYPYPTPMALKYGPPPPIGQGRVKLIEALAAGGEIEAYREELSAKSDDELDRLVAAEKEKQAQERLEAEEAEEQKQFFNQPPATTVDYPHWAKMGTWTINEAVTLSMGRNPKQVSMELIKSKEHSKFVQAYAKRYDLVMRSGLPWEQVGDSYRVKPMAVYNWLKKLELEFPEELGKQLLKFAEAVDWEKAYKLLLEQSRKQGEKLKEVTDALVNAVANQKTEKPLSTVEKNTLLKIIYAMAKDGYGFTPGVRGTAASDIEKAATAAGIKVDADTARKWLKEAADYCKEQGAE